MRSGAPVTAGAHHQARARRGPLTTAAVLIAAAATVAAAASALTPTFAAAEAQPGLLVTPAVAPRGSTVTVTPATPCPPPAGASQPVARIGIGTSRGVSDVIAISQTNAPINSDGSWSASVNVGAAGDHDVLAECLSSNSASTPYVTYASTTVTVPTNSTGYWVVTASRADADGFGDAIGFNGQAILPPARTPLVGVAPYEATGIGYWTADAAGGVFTSGDAAFHGSAGNLRLSSPIVGIAATPTGQGYWLVGADGGVFTFGDAYFAGSDVGDSDHARVIGLVPYGFHTGRGYLIAHADGKVVFLGPNGRSVLNPPLRLNAPIVGIAVTPSESGYYLAGSDGGVFTFGDAEFDGSLGAVHLAAPIKGIDARYDGGYWLLGGDGGVFTFGTAPFLGSDANNTNRGPVTAVGIAATPDPLAPRR